MTSEGDNRIIQARNLHIDEEDDFLLFFWLLPIQIQSEQ